MRKILLLLLCVPMLVCAKSKRDDSKYLVGAVPEVNGQVLFQQTFAVEGKNKQQIYDVMKAYLNRLMKGEQQMKKTNNRRMQEIRKMEMCCCCCCSSNQNEEK